MANQISKASILVASYNYEDYLGDAIESALAQDYENFEVVVTDDGSTDGSRDIIERYVPRVKAIYKANGGLASSFNSGVRHSTGDILFFLDADDISDRNRLSTVMEQYALHPTAEWVFHEQRRVAKDGCTPIAPEPFPVIKEYDLRNQNYDFPGVSTSGLSIRREFSAKIFPMPEASGQLIHDNYMKFATVLMAPGIYLGRALGSLRIHGRNDSSGGQPLPMKLHCDIMMALALRSRHPQLTYFTSKLASGTAASAWTWGDGGKPVKSLYEEYLRTLPFPARMELRAATTLRMIRNRIIGPTERSHGSIAPTYS
jgi:glycosyltransferase involved in cell wall biosynthesis